MHSSTPIVSFAACVIGVSFAHAVNAQDAAPPAPAPIAPEPPVPSPAPAPVAPPPELAPVTPPEPPVVAPPEEKVEAEAEALPIAGYEKGFFIQSPDGNFRLVIGGFVQVRFTYEEPDEGEYASAFSIPRARIALTGHVFTPDLRFKIEPDFGKGGLPTLKDGFADYRIVDKCLHVQAGQYKKPFSRQQLVSDTKLAMVDRTPLDKEFAAGRDIGVSLHNDWSKAPMFEYHVGFFNGAGDQPAFDPAAGSFSNVPDQFDPLLATRVAANFGGVDGYDEVDFSGDELGFSIAANGQVRFNADEDDDAYLAAGGDFMLKSYHFVLHGEVIAGLAQTGPLFADQTFQSLGIMGGAGYLISGTLMPAVRFARILRPDEADQTEILAALSVLAYKHNFQVSSDAGPIIETGGGERLIDFRWRTQLQLQL